MLLGEFFQIISSEPLQHAETGPGAMSFRVTVRLDPGHPIYQGHFPGNPVVPGVCQVQMVRECLEHVKGIKGLLVSGDNIKFISMIVPSEHPVLTIEYNIKDAEGDHLPFSAVLRDDSTVFMKFKGIICTKPS